MRHITLALLAAALLVACSGKPAVVTQYSVPAPEDVVMYEINPRVFAADHSFNAVAEQLDSIQSLGVNVVWFMPLYVTGELKAKNSPYCIRDYRALKPEFGTIDEFKAMVDECHERGLSVIMDWVANHTSWDNAWVSEHPDWYTQDENGNIIHPAGTNWEDVADLNFDNAEMRLAMIDAMRYWVNEADVDGFRCDAADFVPFDFWKQAVDSLRAMPKNLLLLAEGSRKDHFEAGFQMNYAWNFMHNMRQVFIKGEPATRLIEADKEEYEGIPEGCVKLRFTTNHDESTHLTPVGEYGGERGSMSAFVIATYLHGGALIYSSQEVGYADPINFFKYVPVDWESNKEIRAEYKKLMALYNESDAIRKGTLVTYPEDDAMVFSKTAGKEKYLIIASVRNEPVTVAVPDAWKGKTAVNAITGGETHLGETLELEPYQYLILK